MEDKVTETKGKKKVLLSREFVTLGSGYEGLNCVGPLFRMCQPDPSVFESSADERGGNGDSWLKTKGENDRQEQDIKMGRQRDG